MIQLARRQAEAEGVGGRCRFLVGDFQEYTPAEAPDYVVVMGVMDYVADPVPLVERVVSMAGRKAFFSFPAAGGFLAWQRQLRYRSRCRYCGEAFSWRYFWVELVTGVCFAAVAVRFFDHPWDMAANLVFVAGHRLPLDSTVAIADSKVIASNTAK